MGKSEDFNKIEKEVCDLNVGLVCLNSDLRIDMPFASYADGEVEDLIRGNMISTVYMIKMFVNKLQEERKVNTSAILFWSNEVAYKDGHAKGDGVPGS